MPKIIINADDYWISDKFDDAILDLIEKDNLKSVSVIARDDTNNESIKKLMNIAWYKWVSVWLHFEYNQKNSEDDMYENIYNQIKIQYKRFFEIFWKNACHIDKHNREKNENETRAMCDFAIEKNIPVRLYTRWKFFYVYENIYKWKIKITDRLYNLWSIKYWINKIKEDLENPEYQNENREVVCHPGFFDKDYNAKLNWTDMNEIREEDYRKVIELSDFLKNNKLSISSFYDLK